MTPTERAIRAVKAEALRDAAREIYVKQMRGQLLGAPVDQWLEARAEAIEKGADRD